MHRARLAGESFLRWTTSTSMALGSLVGCGLTVYCHPRTLFEDEEGSGGVLGLVGDCVWGVVARSRGFWEVLTSSGLSGTWKTFLGHWGKILVWLGWSCS